MIDMNVISYPIIQANRATGQGDPSMPGVEVPCD
jgi:hypothetical protein